MAKTFPGATITSRAARRAIEQAVEKIRAVRAKP